MNNKYIIKKESYVYFNNIYEHVITYNLNEKSKFNNEEYYKICNNKKIFIPSLEFNNIKNEIENIINIENINNIKNNNVKNKNNILPSIAKVKRKQISISPKKQNIIYNNDSIFTFSTPKNNYIPRQISFPTINNQ